MSHSQGLSNISKLINTMTPIYLRSILILSSYLNLGLPKSLLPVRILKALLSSSVLATGPTHFDLLDLIPLTISVPHRGAFFTLHSHRPWAQIFASG